MAFQQTVETAAGAPVSYWMILREELDYAAGTRTVTLAGYVSEAKRRAGRPFVIPLTFVFTAADFPGFTDLAAIPRTALYAAVRDATARRPPGSGTDERASDAAPLPNARAWTAALAVAQDC